VSLGKGDQISFGILVASNIETSAFVYKHELLGLALILEVLPPVTWSTLDGESGLSSIVGLGEGIACNLSKFDALRSLIKEPDLAS
jgi:hypothetical protein